MPWWVGELEKKEIEFYFIKQVNVGHGRAVDGDGGIMDGTGRGDEGETDIDVPAANSAELYAGGGQSSESNIDCL